jgi:hypothetical protein
MKPPNGFTTPKALSQDMRAQAVTTVLKNRKVTTYYTVAYFIYSIVIILSVKLLSHTYKTLAF